MGGKQYFIDCCNEQGIDCDELFKVGRGDRGGKTRFEYYCEPHSRKKSQIYVVKYFENEDLYLAWSLSVPKAKGKKNFSLARSKVERFSFNEINEANKFIEYAGREEEVVLIFRGSGVKQFLSKAVNDLSKRR